MPKPLSDVLEATPRKPGDVLAEGLQRYRVRRGWSQRDFCRVLADRFGVTFNPATVARIETGQRRVTVDEACMLAVALDVPLMTLMWPIHESEPVSVAPGVKSHRGWRWSGRRVTTRCPTPTTRLGTIQTAAGRFAALRDAALDAEADRGLPKAEYRAALKKLAGIRAQAESVGLSTEGIVPSEVLADLEKAIPPRHQ